MKSYRTAILAMTLTAAVGQDSRGSLRVKTDVPDVQILVDGVEIGRTPLTLDSFKLGEVTITLIKPGFQDESRSINVTAGKPASLFVVMKKIQVQLPDFPIRYLGVHEHTLGRCRGQLIVLRDHLEYKSGEGEDKFEIAFNAVKFLSRSTGPLFVIPMGAPTGGGGAVVGAAGIERTNPAGVLPVRVETKDRKYGFWVYEEGGEASQKTNELYQLVSRLVAESPAPSKKRR